MRCPRCGKSMIGTRATGKTKTYRYYTCWTLQRYGTEACDMPRLNADHLDQALLDAAVEFYRTGHDLITQAVDVAQHDHLADHDTRADELTTVNAELATVAAKIDRYLDAFEDGKLDGDDEDVNQRLANLRAKRQQLRDRKLELEHLIAEQPTAPDPAALDQVAQHISEIVRSGRVTEQKTLVETLVARVTISGNDRFVPTFRIPQQRTAAEHDTGAETTSAGPTPGVRVPTHLVGPRGVEPPLAGT
ncbi:recombinase zinc beta ribbon domain-containing protein [Actinophytocola sp.]|uniref:zinc ribbon domain-containing protein n=1 Tax=Actinophytocola sp. TaxID=1872138 RepID=UPI003D6B2A0A